MGSWMDLNVNSLSPLVTTLGPGRRIGLWLQGCSFRCPGCMTPELFECDKRFCRKIPDVLFEILAHVPGHSGLTISGGEPFEQAEGLRELLFLVRKYTTLDVLIYSGYTLKELTDGPPAMQDVLSLVDVLIDGRYRHDLPASKPWVGSSNQMVHLLSRRAQSDERYINASRMNIPSLQVQIGADNSLHLIGIPRRGDLARFGALLSQRGVELHKQG